MRWLVQRLQSTIYKLLCWKRMSGKCPCHKYKLTVGLTPNRNSAYNEDRRRLTQTLERDHGMAGQEAFFHELIGRGRRIA